MSCRAAGAGDVPWLAVVALANYREVFVPLLPDCDLSSFDEAHFRKRFARAWPRVRIVEGAAGPAGFHLITAGHLDMLFVDPRMQGRGLGGALLADAEACGARSLECFALNAGARRFYERAGWKPAEASTRAFAGAACDFLRYERG